MVEVFSCSPNETELFGEKLGAVLKGGEVIAYFGGLGMGKTTFTSGLCEGMGINAEVQSPTFALVNEYRGDKRTLYHFDMYRIEGWEDLFSCGFFDYKESGGVIAAEWSENIEGALDENTIFVEIERIDDTTRQITVSGVEV